MANFGKVEMHVVLTFSTFFLGGVARLGFGNTLIATAAEAITADCTAARRGR
jgi:hypothetical protein